MTEEPLLPTLAQNRALDGALRDSLRILGDHADDDADDDVRRRIDAVLEGRASLRELARDEEFSAFVGPLAERGWEQYDQLTDEERERLAEEVADADERD
jgi:hypothetical protein